MDRRDFIAAAGTVAAVASTSQAFAQMAAEEPMVHPPKYEALEAARKTWRRLAGQNLLPKLIANVKFKDRIKASPPQARTAAWPRRRHQVSAMPQSRRRIICKSDRNSAASVRLPWSPDC